MKVTRKGTALTREWKEVTVKMLVTTHDEPVLVYRLPSGYTGREIEVYEDAFENLEVKHLTEENYEEIKVGGI